MKEIEEIEEKLCKYPQVRYENYKSAITVFPTSTEGFVVSIEIAKRFNAVSFNGWHENFEQLDEALDCFALGLSVGCRLKECRRGSFAYRWTLETKQKGKWVADSETFLFVFPFWKPKQIYYLQNDIFAAPGSIEG